MLKRETTPFGVEIARSLVLPDRDGNAGDRTSVPPSKDVQTWLDAQNCTSLDYRPPQGVRGGKAARQNPDYRGAGINRRKIRGFYHTLEYPITAGDLCTWLGLLVDFAGSDLLRFKAIVRVADRLGPVLLQGVQQVFRPPTFLTEWPSGDHRTRIVLITRNLNEDCLRELLGILTAAASAQGRLKAAANEPDPHRVVGQP
jgi:G3E family GTPase